MTELVHAWRTWRSFNSQERNQWLLAWLALPLVSFGLRAFGLRRVQTVLDRFAGGSAGRVNFPAAEALARIFHSAVHRSFLPFSCLEQSLVLQWLLRRQGLAADLRIGVAKQDGQFAAHAWLEHGGVALEQNKVYRSFVAFHHSLTSTQRQVE